MGQLGHIMMGVIDSVMVGKVGADSLAAASLVNGLFFLVIVLGIGMSMAVSPLLSISKGAKRTGNCGNILNQSLYVNITFALILMFLIYGMTFVIPMLNQTQAVTKYSISYMRILSLSVIPFILFQSYRQFMEGLSVPNPPMYAAIAANLLNAFLNWILIYGNFGFQAMGLDGAGYATTITRWVMGIGLMLYAVNSKQFKIYDPKFRFVRPDKKLIQKIISIGLPSGVQYFLEVAAFAFAAIMIGWLGSTALAAHQIAINLASATYMIILGISAAGTIRVGNAVGMQDVVEVRKAGYSALTLAVSTMFTFAMCFVLLRNFLPTIYIQNTDVVELASKLLIVAALFQLSDGIQATGAGILRGLTDVKVPMAIIFTAYWVMAIPLAYFLGFGQSMGAIGIWIGLSLGLTTVAVMLSIRFNRMSKNLIDVFPN